MLPTNSVILFETIQGKRYERILYRYKDIIYLIDIYGNSMPTTVSESFIQNGLNDGTIFVLENEPYMIIKEEEDILPKHKAIRDKAYNAIKDIVTFEPDIYIPDKRVKLVREYIDNIHEATVMRYLKRFWQRGMHKNSLLPDYYKCGKTQGDKVINNTFIITPETVKIFNAALNRFYYNSSQKTLTLTYELMIKEYFSENGIVNDEIPINNEVINFYSSMTKGEIVEEFVDNPIFKEYAKDTISCSHPCQSRYDGIAPPQNCGYCYPCIIRKASMNKINYDETSYYNPNYSLSQDFISEYDNFDGKASDFRAVLLSLKNFLDNQNDENYLNYILLKHGILSKDELDKYKRVYVESMKEIFEMIQIEDRRNDGGLMEYLGIDKKVEEVAK